MTTKPLEGVLYNSRGSSFKLAKTTDVQPEHGGPLYEKEVMYEGEFLLQTGAGERFTDQVDETLLSHWAGTFAKMRDAGVAVPVPLEHTSDPEKRRGTVLDMKVRRNTKGKSALFAVVEFADDEAAKLAKTADTSIYVPYSYEDGSGTKFYRPIQHVALTDYPIIPGLQGFESLAAGNLKLGGKKMPNPLAGLAKKLGLEVKDGDTGLEGKIASAYKALKSSVSDLTSKLEAASKKLAKLEESSKKKPATVAAGMLALARDNWSLKMDPLVTSGKMSPASKKALQDIFCSDESLSLSLSEDSNPMVGLFDKVLEIFRTNETVQLGPGTGPQLMIAPDKLRTSENPLVADAERRAKAAAG